MTLKYWRLNSQEQQRWGKKEKGKEKNERTGLSSDLQLENASKKKSQSYCEIGSNGALICILFLYEFEIVADGSVQTGICLPFTDITHII